MYHMVKRRRRNQLKLQFEIGFDNLWYYASKSKIFSMNFHMSLFGYHLYGTGTGTMIEHIWLIDSVFNIAFEISMISYRSKKSCQGTNNHQEYWINCSGSSWHSWRLLLDDIILVPVISFFGNLIKTAVKGANILNRTNHVFVLLFR